MEEESLSPPSILSQQVETGSQPSRPNSPNFPPVPSELFNANICTQNPSAVLRHPSLTVIRQAPYSCGSTSMNVRARTPARQCLQPTGLHMTHTVVVRTIHKPQNLTAPIAYTYSIYIYAYTSNTTCSLPYIASSFTQFMRHLGTYQIAPVTMRKSLCRKLPLAMDVVNENGTTLVHNRQLLCTMSRSST